MIHRAFRYRLYPTAEQAEALARTAGVARFVYNLALEQRRDFARRGRNIGFASQCRELTQLRAEVDWIAECSSDVCCAALRDLDNAFLNLFRGGGYPRFRRAGDGAGFRCKGRDVRVRGISKRWAEAKLPKLGWVRFRKTRELRGRTLRVSVTSDALGWHIAFGCEIEHEAPANLLPSVGIDRGIANTLALSTGELLSTPSTARLERRKKRAQRILARRNRGSARYRKQRRRVAGIAAKIARVRADWRHKATTDIANRFGLVTIEALKTRNMTARGRGKRGLNRTILEQGWSAFERVLAYKLEERGGRLEKVNPAYTSQTCSECGTIDKANRESQASFACRHCGFAAHADTNAAVNILRRSTAPMLVEGSAYAPVEARTDHALAA